ncbi:linear amide C-N hydrolase (choloylglycine hydrolase family) [Natranaerovirga pectinivora]|uniref:Linear amide C-N hydrolase (Choloylglycine hydrolase family) n=1 Tax=Natranaerovirga pectinivora TaxID=682400 RepID=A0A4R3MLC4_9FIRM|nr:C45 family peptidase [Natranaerovirga pectinivora]TCT15428.1 linear amide C-N hydrolase (choloylglycine hydrolase family) [Natranaerovirga pectinivora]
MKEIKNGRKVKKKQSIRKIFLIVISIIIVPILMFVGLFHNEIATIASIKKVGNLPFYEMKYYGGYSFDKYIEKGASSEEELESFIKNNLAYGLLDGWDEIYDFQGCAVFTATTPEGDRIFAKNFDYPYTIPVVIETNPKNSYQSIAMGSYAFFGWNNDTDDTKMKSKLTTLAAPYLIVDGMNEKGLAVSTLTLEGSKAPVDKDKKTFFDITILRYILDKAGTVEEALEIISQYNIALYKNYPSHFIFADATGDSIIIEFVNKEMKVIDQEKDYQIITNHQLYNNPNPRRGCKRYSYFERTLTASNGILTVEEALELLHSQANRQFWSVVYNLTQRTVAVTFHNDLETVYYYEI